MILFFTLNITANNPLFSYHRKQGLLWMIFSTYNRKQIPKFGTFPVLRNFREPG